MGEHGLAGTGLTGDRVQPLPQPQFVHDLPNGAGRYVQGASGYDYTIVNGEVFMDHGQHTGQLAGRLVRSQA